MSVLLVITAGQTDVQFVRGQRRCKIAKSLHGELERRAGEWRIVDPPLEREKDEVSELPTALFQVCTPKLDAVLNYIEKQGTAPSHALILDTQRDRCDPRFAGPILEKRLHDRLSIGVRRTTFLVGNERLEDPSDPRDAIIRRQVVERIDMAVRDVIENCAPKRIVVAATGGFPSIAVLVDEVVRLHAGRGIKVDLVEVPEMGSPTREEAVERRREPAESYKARWHALDLIESGNFIGAWGAVRHLDDDEVERGWTQVVEWLYLFAASLPLPEECDISVLKHKSMAVCAAIRVELALKSGDVPRAVHGTVAFFEAALWDHLRPMCVKEHPKRLFQFQPAPEDKLVREANGNERDRPFVRRTEDGETWYRVDDSKVCAIRLAKHYLRSVALEKLGQAISEEVRELRNDAAHSEPTPSRMDGAREIMRQGNLWSEQGRFLVQPLVQDVLKDLGEEHPESLCKDLMDTVRSRLVSSTF